MFGSNYENPHRDTCHYTRVREHYYGYVCIARAHVFVHVPVWMYEPEVLNTTTYWAYACFAESLNNRIGAKVYNTLEV